MVVFSSSLSFCSLFTVASGPYCRAKRPVWSRKVQRAGRHLSLLNRPRRLNRRGVLYATVSFLSAHFGQIGTSDCWVVRVQKYLKSRMGPSHRWFLVAYTFLCDEKWYCVVGGGVVYRFPWALSHHGVSRFWRCQKQKRTIHTIIHHDYYSQDRNADLWYVRHSLFCSSFDCHPLKCCFSSFIVVRLGKSGLKISKIILGMMSYGDSKWTDWVLDEEEAIKHKAA